MQNSVGPAKLFHRVFRNTLALLCVTAIFAFQALERQHTAPGAKIALSHNVSIKTARTP